MGRSAWAADPRRVRERLLDRPSSSRSLSLSERHAIFHPGRKRIASHRVLVGTLLHRTTGPESGSLRHATRQKSRSCSEEQP